MPAAIINLLKGHDRGKLKQIIREVTNAMHETLVAPKERLMVWINEVDGDLWGIAGVPASEVKDLEAVKNMEIPFVQMILMEGRPTEQLHTIMDQIAKIISENLNMNKSQVRIRISLAQPDLWSIGGIPASISRAKELEARKLQLASG